MSHVTITIGNVLKTKRYVKSVAVDMYLSTMKYKNAVMFHNTIVKLAANKYPSTMMLNIANPAKNGFVKRNADIHANTTISMYVAMPTAQLHVLPAVLDNVTLQEQLS
jgi:hypothetical protein